MYTVDFHNHVIPGVDDGASDDAEAASALHAFLAHNTRQIIATPHVNGSLSLRPELLEERLREIDAGWVRLERIARENVPEMVVHRGAEVMLDTPEPDLSDERLRLAGTHFALCEYPFMTVPPNSTGVLNRLVAAGVTPIIAHPERYVGVDPRCVLPLRWRAAGALLQVNAGSLSGRYGEQARFNAFAILEHALADYICSDYHARGRPSTAGAAKLITDAGGEEQLQLLTSVNATRLLQGELPLPVAPLRLRLGVKDRLRRWMR
ncbi:MAG TPA: CpsB/CapC family capsule biosynthesis tyrosine phosphatase [Longimicrobiales bacterium]|nr:CpsB/CapC family capsule biosynthesis tyrosine phosphatase [Longimicrobiales bacterium]